MKAQNIGLTNGWNVNNPVLGNGIVTNQSVESLDIFLGR